MKNKSTPATAITQRPAKAKTKPRYTENAGQIAVMFYGGCDHEPRAENGPCVVLFERGSYADVIKAAPRWASGKKGEILGVATAGGEVRRVLVFTPFTVDDHRFLSAAAGNDCKGINGPLAIEEVAKVRKHVKFVQTKLRGEEFTDHLRRMIDVISPEIVIVWPVGYFLGVEGPKAEQRLLEKSEFLMPKSLGLSSRTAEPRWKLRDDGDDHPSSAADWWKNP